jgi:ketosteroid isomerase-like protein
MQDAQCAELAEVFRQSIELYNAGELEAYFATMHDQVTYLLAGGSEPISGKARVRDMYERWLGSHEAVQSESINLRFLVEGATGIVFGRYRHRFKGPGEARQSREGWNTVVYLRSGDSWLKLSEDLAECEAAGPD